jgi:hypothetical protein
MLLRAKVAQPINNLADWRKTSSTNHEGMAERVSCVAIQNGNEERRGETSGP